MHKIYNKCVFILARVAWKQSLRKGLSHGLIWDMQTRALRLKKKESEAGKDGRQDARILR